MDKIFRAGLIPVFVDDDNNLHMFFMKPSDPKYGGSDYQIAKGRIEDGEDPLDAAIRESSEELGLRSSNIDQIYECGKWLGRTHFYVATVKRKEDFGQFHFETESTKWMTPNEFETNGRELHRDIVKHAAKLIEMVIEQ